MNTDNIKLPSNSNFGFFFTIIFILVGVYFIYEASTIIAYIFFFLAAALLMITILKPNLLLPFNVLWMKIGFFLGKIFSPIFLGILFFGLFTPISILMRIFQRDELRIKLKNRVSHWKLRNTDNNEKDSFKNQF